MHIKSFSQFNESHGQIPVTYLQEIKTIEEWLHELGIEIVSSNSYGLEDQPYTIVKFLDGSYILTHVRFGKKGYMYYKAVGVSSPAVKSDDLTDFLDQIRPMLKK